MLLFLIILPILGAIILVMIPKANNSFSRLFSLYWSILVFNFSILLLFVFDPSITWFQLCYEIP